MKYASTDPNVPEVAEILGLYGPVGISELLIQKIWLRRDFVGDALRTTDGRALKVIKPGRWNRLDGPDFIGAEIELGDQRILGDVEIHFYQRDWSAHRHETNPSFNGVVLHVVVFDIGENERPAVTAAGRTLPTLVLAPTLREGLEEYAMGDAIRMLEQTDPLELAAPLLALPLVQRRERMRSAATLRWDQKRHFAAKRLAASGSWEDACHQCVLEILGYRRNRVAMAELGLRFPLASWRRAFPGWVDQLYEESPHQWQLQGSRPANHPRQRLRQYARLVAANPFWPTELAAMLKSFAVEGEAAESTEAFRRRLRLGPLRRKIFEDVWAGAIASPRADTILIDGILPLACEHFQNEKWEAAWHHWWPGDLPDALRTLVRTAQLVTPPWPLSNGLQQAALQCLIEAER